MLDSDQARVVAHDDGPAAVLAGAGSGKTRCTTERAVRRLTECRVPSDGLVLLTFTNKAAGEMRERLRERLAESVRLPWIGTFHSFGNQLLRQHGKAVGVPRNATLMDADDARRMLDAMLAGPFPDKGRRLEATRVFDGLLAAGLDATDDEDVPAITALGEAAGFGPVACARLLEKLRRFEREKRRAAVLDFGDLIHLPIRLLRTDEGLRERVRGRLRDLTVDEAQDTDGAQFRLLNLLVPESRTVLLVGDDDQAIYEWRHARPENMRDFIESFGARIYRLERNYRSTPAIVTGGAALVRHNENRLEKNPYAVRTAPRTDRVRLNHYRDADAMADGLSEQIGDAVRRGTSPADIAVLYRKNRLSRIVETALLRRGVPYRIKAGADLLSYADVRMMLAAGRLATNRRDARALARLADLVPGLGARGVSRLISGGDDPFANLERLAPRAASGAEKLFAAIDGLADAGPAELFDWCRRTPVFNDWLVQRARRSVRAGAGKADDVEQALRAPYGRMRAVQAAMRRRLDSLDAAADTAARWGTALEVIAAGTDEAESDAAKVTLCTVHAAKGLEWPEVHLFGFSEGLMPMARDGAVENLAEERRLAYVAITRARNRLTLHHADRIDLGTGVAERPEVSRFIAEIACGQQVETVDRRPGASVTDGEENPRDWLAEMRKALS